MDTFVDSSLVLPALPARPHYDDAPFDRARRRRLAAGRPVHRRLRARRHAPDVLPLLHQGAARHGPARLRRADAERCATRARSWAPTQAHEQVARQRAGARRAGGSLRRRHGPRVPDVHRAVGPGRPVEPVGHRGHPSLAGPGVGHRPTGQGQQSRRRRAGRPEEMAARLRRATHTTIAAVSDDYEALHFNTAISS